MPRVSIVIPAFNREVLIQQTLDSIFAQTFTDIEVIVVDDCSTDGTKAMLDRKYPGKVRYIRNETNLGLTRTCNVGLRAATGEFVSFLDSDDLIEPTKIEKQIAVMDARPEISVVNVRHWHIDQNGVKLDKTGLLPEGERVLHDLVLVRMWWIGGTLFRRTCFDIIGTFDENLIYQDWNIWLRCALAGLKFACVQEPLGSYRLHPVTMSGSASNAERIVPVLDDFWSKPDVPADVQALKAESYANMHRYVASLYYHAEQWADGARHLSAAAQHQPAWAADARQIADAIYAAAQMRRIADPVKFVVDVFGHLPKNLGHTQVHRSRVVAQAKMLSAMRAYTAGNFAEGKRRLADALSSQPNAALRRKSFADILSANAIIQPELAPAAFVERVFNHLPANADDLRTMRNDVIGEVAVANAFEEYALHHRAQVPAQVIRAIRHRPALLGNRGVLSIFVKSLVAR
jgi:glycosyltransferase involved in cell wall biosynthesis